MAADVLKEPDIGSKPSKSKDDGRIQCVVVTPERTLFDELVNFIALPLYDGEIGILPGRAPLIGRLGYGELRTRTDVSTNRYFVDGGFVQVRDDVVTVLTHRATPAANVDPMGASQELERAQAMVATTDEQQAEKTKALVRARAQLRVASHAR
jgi:F-type H+-transporting ATPase subunit epsilon